MLSKHELSFLFRNSRSKLPLGATPIRAPTVREGYPHAWIPLPYGRGSDRSVFSRKAPPCAGAAGGSARGLSRSATHPHPIASRLKPSGRSGSKYDGDGHGTSRAVHAG